MKLLKYILTAGWGGLALGVTLLFALHRFIGPLLAPVANYIVLVPIVLMIGTAAYKLLSHYRAGMSRGKP